MRLTSASLFAAVTIAGIAAPAAAAPPVAQTCFSYSTDQWVQAEYTAVAGSCDTAHNGEVLAVVGVPADVEATGYGSAAMKGWGFQVCQSAATTYVWKGKSLRYPQASYVMPRSARLNVQIPTGQQWAEGQRWVACLGQSRNQKLSAPQARTGSVRALGLSPYVCYSTRTWNGKKCGTPDAVRMTNQVWLPKGHDMDYPGSDRLLGLTRKACQKLAKRKDQVRSWFVPGLSAWDRGNRYGFCHIGK